MLDRSSTLILGLALLASVLGGIVEHGTRQPTAANSPPSALIGQPLPALALPDLDGRMHALAEYRGQRVLMNFWATWCAPCLDEMPALQRAQRKFGEHGAIVVGIGMDSAEHVRAFLAGHPLNYPILLGDMRSPSTSLRLGDTAGILPYSVLIGTDGSILDTHAGALSKDQLEQWLGGKKSTR